MKCIPFDDKARCEINELTDTLRGNLGPEIRGTLRGSGRGRALVAPAFPAAGRTTVAGRQLLNGISLEKTSFARDVRSPVASGRLSERLAPLDAAQYTVHDASEDRDLDELVSRARSDPAIVWVGSPGLAAALARATPHQTTRKRPQPAGAKPVERVLVVVGSLHEANTGQLQCLAAAGAGMVSIVHAAEPDNLATDADRIRHCFATTSVVALVSPRDVPDDAGAAAATVSARIAALVSRCAPLFNGLVLTGGDTARQVVGALHGSRLDLDGEVEPGVAFGILTTPAGHLPFAAKAGGFGSPTTLLNCVARVRAAACWTDA